MTLWPSGLRRYVKAVVFTGVGSNPIEVNFFALLDLNPTTFSLSAPRHTQSHSLRCCLEGCIEPPPTSYCIPWAQRRTEAIYVWWARTKIQSMTWFFRKHDASIFCTLHFTYLLLLLLTSPTRTSYVSLALTSRPFVQVKCWVAPPLVGVSREKSECVHHNVDLPQPQLMLLDSVIDNDNSLYFN